MFNKSLFTLSLVIALAMRLATKFLLTTSILAAVGTPCLPAVRPFAYAVNGYTVVRRSELGPLTGATVDNSLHARGPGHDYGAINGTTDIGLSLNTDKLFAYAVNGYTVVRRSELGPLTGTPVDNSLHARGPGHDYSAINGTTGIDLSLASMDPCTYTTNGQ